MEGQTNGLCIAGFIVSLGSLFLGLFGITGLVGTVLSAVGRSKAVDNGGKTGLGTAGIILGVIGAAYCWVMLAIAAAPDGKRSYQKSPQQKGVGTAKFQRLFAFWRDDLFFHFQLAVRVHIHRDVLAGRDVRRR